MVVRRGSSTCTCTGTCAVTCTGTCMCCGNSGRGGDGESVVSTALTQPHTTTTTTTTATTTTTTGAGVAAIRPWAVRHGLV